MSLPAANVSTSAASTTRSASTGGEPTDPASNLVNRISTFDGAAPAGTTSRTVESVVVISISSFVGTDGGAVTVSVTSTSRGVFDAPFALMTILPLCVPASNPEASTDTLTVTLACGLFDAADAGENDNQFAADERVNGMSVCRTAFHTVNVCAGGASPPCTAVNASVFVERPTSGCITTGVGIGVGTAMGPPPPPPPPPPKLPPPPPPPPDGGGGGGVGGPQVSP